MKIHSKSDILALREIHHKKQRKAQINEIVRNRARQLFEEEFQKQQEAESQILKKDAVKQINEGALQFKEFIFWDGIIEKLLLSKVWLTPSFLQALTLLQDQECLSPQSQERLVKFLLDQQILEKKSDSLVVEAIELLIILGYRFKDEMLVIQLVLRLISHKRTQYILREILTENEEIFNTMTEEIRYFITQIYEQADLKDQERIVQVILRQRPQLVDQDRSLFGLPLKYEESDNQKQN
ncbi:hypothetical protein pb186bvf_014053 [Paramecium bursaria]